MSWIAEYDTQGRDFPTCVHMTKDAGTIRHGVTYVPVEDGAAMYAEYAELREENERFVIKLNAEHIARQNAEAENAKLRECLQGLAEHIREDDGFGLDYGWMLDRMRELGVEV